MRAQGGLQLLQEREVHDLISNQKHYFFLIHIQKLKLEWTTMHQWMAENSAFVVKMLAKFISCLLVCMTSFILISELANYSLVLSQEYCNQVKYLKLILLKWFLNLYNDYCSISVLMPSALINTSCQKWSEMEMSWSNQNGADGLWVTGKLHAGFILVNNVGWKRPIYVCIFPASNLIFSVCNRHLRLQQVDRLSYALDCSLCVWGGEFVRSMPLYVFGVAYIQYSSDFNSWKINSEVKVSLQILKY